MGIGITDSASFRFNKIGTPSHLSSLTGAASASSVTDTTLNVTFPLATDLDSYEIQMTSGAQSGEKRKVATYTPGTGVVTVASPFSGTPLASDTYKLIAPQIWSKTLRGFTATISLTFGPTNYALNILPGPVDSNHGSLRDAKNTFRKFLFDKPVDT